MDNLTVYEQQILSSLKDFPPELLAEVADFIEFIRRRRLIPPIPAIDAAGNEIRKSWLDLAGAIAADDLALMSEAIEEGCEQVNLDEW